MMACRVIQGFFLGGAMRPQAVAKAPACAPRAGHLPGPPSPAFARAGPPVQARMAPGRPALAHHGAGRVAQPHGGDGSFEIDPAQIGLARGGGTPLPQAVLAKMEAAFGADFSGVRVHVGPQASRIGAVAFTTGNDLYFAPGQFQPNSVKGQQLLGHELAHVIQQRQGRVRAPASGVAVVQDRMLEAEADRLGMRAAAFVQPMHRAAKSGPRSAIAQAKGMRGAADRAFGHHPGAIQRSRDSEGFQALVSQVTGPNKPMIREERNKKPVLVYSDPNRYDHVKKIAFGSGSNEKENTKLRSLQFMSQISVLVFQQMKDLGIANPVEVQALWIPAREVILITANVGRSIDDFASATKGNLGSLLKPRAEPWLRLPFQFDPMEHRAKRVRRKIGKVIAGKRLPELLQTAATKVFQGKVQTLDFSEDATLAEGTYLVRHSFDESKNIKHAEQILKEFLARSNLKTEKSVVFGVKIPCHTCSFQLQEESSRKPSFEYWEKTSGPAFARPTQSLGSLEKERYLETILERREISRMSHHNAVLSDSEDEDEAPRVPFIRSRM